MLSADSARRKTKAHFMCCHCEGQAITRLLILGIRNLTAHSYKRYPAIEGKEGLIKKAK